MPNRLATPKQRFHIALRDGGCLFPGCDRPPMGCEAHHRQQHIDGGPTAEHNLDLFCPFHHVQVHEGGWTYTIIDADTLEFYPPGGGPPLRSKRRRSSARLEQTPPPRTHRSHRKTPQNIGNARQPLYLGRRLHNMTASSAKLVATCALAIMAAATGCASQEPGQSAAARASASLVTSAAQVVASRTGVHPASARVFHTTRANAATAVDASATGRSADAPVTVILFSGAFTDHAARVPPGSKAIVTGTEISLVYDENGKSTDYGVEKKPVDTSALGDGETVPVP